MEWIVVLLLFGAAGLGHRLQSRKEKAEAARREAEAVARLEIIRNKYLKSNIAEMIVAGEICTGMTHEMVLDSWGHPAAVEHKTYKSKTKTTLKYDPGPRRTFRTRVFLENERVVGWEKR